MREMDIKHGQFKLSNLPEIKLALVKSLAVILSTGSLSSFAFGSGTLQSQAPQRVLGHPTQHSHRPSRSLIDNRVDSLTRQVGLDENQRKETRTILETGQAEANRLWSDQQISPIDRMTKLHQLRDDSQNKFRALLTPAQRTKYDQLLQNKRRATSQPNKDVYRNSSEQESLQK
jgi:hypothetical protein